MLQDDSLIRYSTYKIITLTIRKFFKLANSKRVRELEAIPDILQAARYGVILTTGCLNEHDFTSYNFRNFVYSFKEKNKGKKSLNMFSDTPLSKSFTFKCQTSLKILQVRPKFADFYSIFTALFCTCGTMLSAAVANRRVF